MYSKQISPEEVLKRNRETFITDTLQNFKVLVDTVGVEKVINIMDGDTFWKLYKFFETTAGDKDR